MPNVYLFYKRNEKEPYAYTIDNEYAPYLRHSHHRFAVPLPAASGISDRIGAKAPCVCLSEREPTHIKIPFSKKEPPLT